MKLADFKPLKKYKYIGKAALFTPYGVLTAKNHPFTYTGRAWRKILLYDFDNDTPISKMFKEVKK